MNRKGLAECYPNLLIHLSHMLYVGFLVSGYATINFIQETILRRCVYICNQCNSLMVRSAALDFILIYITGRDSVQAMRKRNDLTPRYDVSQEEIDEDLIWRIEALLIKSQSYIDIPDLRAAFQARDSQKTGKIEGSVVRALSKFPVNSREDGRSTID